MEWISKQGDLSSFLKEFLEIFKNEDFSFDNFEKGQIQRPFSGLAPSKLNFFSTKFNDSRFANKVFYMPIFIRIETKLGTIALKKNLMFKQKKGHEKTIK